MPRKRTVIDDTLRNRILSMAKQQDRRKAGINVPEITSKINAKFGTNLTMYQVGACIGNAGYRSG